MIEAAQPYKDAPVGAALASLQSLSNDDKHHDIHTVVVGTAGLDLEFHRVNATIVGSEPLWRVMDRPPPLLEERMGVFRFTLGDVSDDPHVNVSGRVTPYAGFDDRAPVLSHLAHLADAVRDLLGQLDEDVPALVRPPDWAPG